MMALSAAAPLVCSLLDAKRLPGQKLKNVTLLKINVRKIAKSRRFGNS